MAESQLSHTQPEDGIPASSMSSPFGYSVILASVADDPDETTPVGVVVWNSAQSWYGSRWLAPNETLPGVDGTTRRFMQIVRAQIDRWAGFKRVPYEPGPVEPTTDRFWKAVSEILSTAIRIDLPQSMDPMNDPAEEMEVLFQAMVHPELRGTE